MILILGGGLAGSLLAFRLSKLDPCPEFLLIESQKHLGGEHTWSFHESDLPLDCLDWIAPLLSRTWERQEVKFQDFKRVFSNPYHSVKASDFSREIEGRVRNHLLLNESVLSVNSNQVTLQSGKTLQAQVIFDARGLNQDSLRECGYQKFVGMDLRLKSPHGMKHPIIMDVTCKQKEGFRFFYLLPWDSHSILIEDTRYTSDSNLNIDEFREEIRLYCKKSNWEIEGEERIEVGSLPIPFTVSVPLYRQSGIVPIGMRGGYFHWTTGYSFPLAVQVANSIAEEFRRNPRASEVDLENSLAEIRMKVQKQAQFLSLLNRMLFLAANPLERWRIFHRFYTLNEKLIFRFYEGNLKWSDRARLLIGKPPVPIGSALKSIWHSEKHLEYRREITRERQI